MVPGPGYSRCSSEIAWDRTRAEGDTIVLEVAKIGWKDQIEFLKNRLLLAKDENPGTLELLYRLRGESMPRQSEPDRTQFISAEPQGVIPRGTRVDYLYVDRGDFRPEYYTWYITKVGRSFDDWSRFARINEIHLKHFRHVWDEDPGHYVVNVFVQSRLPESQQGHFPGFKLTYDQEVVAETDDRGILGQAHAEGSAAMSFTELQESRKLAAQQVLEMGTPKDQRDPANPERPYVALLRGDNPSKALGDFNSYQLMGAHEDATTFHWFVTSRDMNAEHPLARAFRFGTVENVPVVFLDHNHDIVEVPLKKEEVLEIYCQQLNAKGEVLGVTRYMQTVTNYRVLDALGQQSKKILKTVAEDEQQLREAVGWQRAAVPLKATHLDGRTGVLRTSLRLYMDLKSTTYYLDRHQSMTGRQIVVPEFRIIDLEHPTQEPYTGETVEEAIADFKGNNKFVKGRMRVTVPPIDGWIDRQKFPNGAMWDFETTGETDAEAVGKWAGGVSTGAMFLGIALMSNPLSFPLGLAVSIVGSLGGAIAAGSSVYEELRKKKPDPLRIAVDVAGIAASLVSVLRNSTRLAIEGALFYGNEKMAITLAHSAEKFTILERVAGMGSTILVQTDRLRRVIETLSKKHLSQQDMTAELKAIFWELVESDALVMVVNRLLPEHHQKLPDRTRFDYDEPGNSLVQPNPAAGAGKATPAPVVGKPPAGAFVGPASPLWQGDLGAAGLRQRKLPAVSVREAPAGEHASVLERKGQAGPGAGPIGNAAHAHASDGAAGGPPSSLDLSFGSGGPGKRPQGPVPPRALAPGVFRSPVTEQLLLAQDVSWDHPEVRAQLDPIRKMMRLVGSDSDTGAHSPEFLPLVLSSAQAHVQQNPGQSIRLITVEIKNLAGLNTSFGTTGANQVLGGVIHQLTQPMRLALMEKGSSVTVLRLGGPRVALVVVGLADDAAIRRALGNGLKNARKYTDRVEVPVLGDPLLEARVKDMRHPKYPNDPRETGSGIQVLHSVEVDSGETVANLLARREEALVAIDAGHGAIRKRRNPGKPQVDAGETAEPPIPEVERPMGPRSKFDPRVERAPRDSDALLAAGGDAADAMPRQVVRDVTDALRQVAGDATTGLYARGVLVPTLEDAIGWRRAHPDERASVVVFDVRNLSGMTDHLGTKEADVHFRKMVDILKDAHGVELPTAKLVGVRFGGDEFGFVVVGKYTPAQLEAAVGKATRAVEAYVNSTMVTLQSSKVPVPLNTVPHRKPGKPRGTGVTGATVDIVDGATPREVLVAMDALDAAKARAKKGEPNVENIYNPYVSLDDVVQHNLATRPRDIVAEMLAPTAGLGMTDPDPRFAVGGRKAEVHNHIMGVLETEHLIAEAAHGDPEVMARRLYEFFEKNPDARGGAANSWEAVQSACRILEMANRAPDRVKWAKVSAVVRRRVGEALEAGKRTAFDHTYEARDELSNTYLDPRPRPVGNVPSGEKPPKQPFERTARDVIARLHADGIHYVEMSTSAGKLADRFPVAAMTRAHADNRARGTDVDIRFLAMFPTELFGPDADKLTAKYEKLLVDMKALLKRPDVIGFDIAGPERDRFSKTGIKRMHELMKILAEEAQRRGSDMVFRPHVGEGYEPIEGRPAGSEPHEVVAHANIDSALKAVETSDSLKRANGVGVVVRFGHATHADPTQIRRMGRLGIIAEANIGSNLATRSIPSLFSTDGEALVHPGAQKPAVSNHPLLTNLYYDTPTILSTDAHGVMTTTLTAEYARAAQIIDAFKRGEILMKVEGGTLSYGQLTLDQRAKFDISRLWKWQSDYFGSVQVSDAMGGLRRKPPPQPSSAVRGVSEGSFDVEIPALPPPVRRRSPADEREERDDEDREQSAPLASPELTIIATWTKLRNFYLQRWGGFTGVSSFSAATRRLFDTSAEASVRQVMTPDELTALIKERGGARALGGSGRASQRAQAAARACDSLRQAILAIKERLVELHRAPETALPGEIPALHLKLKDLSELLGFYEKY
ncbi:diguanylate cyclase domain-containing protein [Nannocystis pusilla]|uniref:diguanylate cyclase domain-containing protein n=1 Tax=Nannocystis pusilla TaxID=889268 RepID=UPI003BF1C873